MQMEIIVVDNNSKDGSVEYVAQHFPEVQIIRNNYNRGYATANNQGLAVATGRNILFLNSDTVVHKGALEAMAGLLDSNPRAGACGCKLVNADGSTQPSVRHFPTFAAFLQRYTIFKHFGLFERARGYYKMREFDYNKCSEVDQIMGAVLMVKRSVLEEVGPMDEKFKFYFEETDLCQRISNAGFTVYFTPSGRIIHLKGGSSDAFASSTLFAIFLESLFYYLRKHKGRIKTFFFGLVFKPGLCAHMFCQMLWGLCSGAFFWCLRRDKGKIRHRLGLGTESGLFLLKHGLNLFLY
jgi:GT2 family glycosyltransferase